VLYDVSWNGRVDVSPKLVFLSSLLDKFDPWDIVCVPIEYNWGGSGHSGHGVEVFGASMVLTHELDAEGETEFSDH
jgi:hypothetical protein